MKKIGSKIYFDKSTGNIIVNTGEMIGSVIETTIDQDFETYHALKERVRDTVGVIQLEYGQYADEFSACTSYRVNPQTLEIEFNYDPLFNLEEYKNFKIEELKKKCQEDIFSGFISQVNGHHYRTNADDQINFLGKFNQLMADTNIQTVMWKTEDMGYIEHTREDWLTIYSEGLTAKEQKLFKYDQLKQQVMNATTKEEVEAIVW